MIRILWAVVLGVAAATGSGCQPAALKPDAVVVPADVVGDGQFGLDVADSLDSSEDQLVGSDGGDVAGSGDADADADATDAAVETGPDVPADVPAECTADKDCAAKAAACQIPLCIKGTCKADPAPDKSQCTDNDPCTTGDQCLGGKCGGTDQCTECKADTDCPVKDLCEGKRFCDKAMVPYQCKPVGPGVQCPDTEPGDCSVPTCDPKVGQCKPVQKANGAKCDDGVPCTLQDSCDAGKCVFETNTCPCLATADCASKEDGDLCNGTLYCDKSSYTCKINPATVVTCPTAADTDCATAKCETTTGKCKLMLAEDGKLCDDNNACTLSEACEGGKCTPSAGNKCLCKSTKDCAAQEDDSLCNGTLYCDIASGQCKVNPASVVVCPASSNPCLKNICKKEIGKCQAYPVEMTQEVCVGAPGCGNFVAKPAGASPNLVVCDDGDSCTLSSGCKSGQCLAEPTSYGCSCAQDVDCAPKEDNNLCNGTLYCNKSSGKCEVNPITVVTCSSVNDTTCAAATCDKATGKCALTPLIGDKLWCDDGNPCTLEQCLAGKCVATQSTCGCLVDGDCAAQEDSDACNGTLFCNPFSKKCEVNPATVVTCSAVGNTSCVLNLCDQATGKCAKTPLNDQTACDDGNPCTYQDVCNAGECVSGANNLCDCLADADCAAKEDKDLCNGTLYCDKSKAPFQCKLNPATVVSCPGGQDSQCLRNQCDIQSGKCKMGPPPGLAVACTDGNPCTSGDLCFEGECVSGLTQCACGSDKDCLGFDDDNLCNGTLSCVVQNSTKVCAVNPGTIVKCQPGSECKPNVCEPASGTCKSVENPLLCNDNNPCTNDSCSGGVCQFKPVSGEIPCGSGKVCKAGFCSGS